MLLTDRGTYNPPMQYLHIRQLCQILACLAAVSCGSAGAQIADVAQQKFVRQLMDRQLYGMAESYCLNRLEQANTPATQAQWVLLLTDCWHHRSWREESGSRQSLLNLTATRITEFLQSNVVPPVLELRLRLQQSRSLLLMVQQDAFIDDAGRLSRGAPSVPAAAAMASRSKQQAVHLQTAQDVVDALLLQLEQIRRDLDAVAVRVIRNEARILLADIHLQQALQVQSAERRERHLQQAEEIAESLVKASTDIDVPQTARRILVSVLAARGQTESAGLRAEALRASAVGARQEMAALRTEVRLLLSEQQASQALSLLQSWKVPDITVLAEWQYLTAEAHLAVYELVDQLDRPGEQDSAIESCRNAFRRARANATGVWLEATQVAESRFQNVQLMGVTAADLSETVNELVAAGQSEQASKHLDGVLQSLPARLVGTAAHGTLLARRGELAVAALDYDNAVPLLTRALEMVSNTALAAPTDLLRCFALGQQWKQRAEDMRLREVYESALREHIEAYGAQPTVVDARRWLILLYTESAPIAAAQQHLALMQDLSEPAEQTLQLSLAAELLFTSWTNTSETAAGQPQPFEELRESADELAAGGQISAEVRAVAGTFSEAARVLVEARGGAAMQTSLKRLLEFQRVFADYLTTHPDIDPTDPLDTAIRAAAARGLTATLVCQARQAAGASVIEKLVAQITGLSALERSAAARYAMHCLAESAPYHPGDVAIARIIPTILPTLNAADATLAECLDLLEVVSRTSRVSGDEAPLESLLETAVTLARSSDDYRRIAVAVAGNGVGVDSSAPPSESVRRFLAPYGAKLRIGKRAVAGSLSSACGW
jgi:tetratricopeptide (TPR) repeat protein